MKALRIYIEGNLSWDSQSESALNKEQRNVLRKSHFLAQLTYRKTAH